MKVLFTILTIAGWTWTAALAVMLVVHLRREKARGRTDHEQAAR